jgi:NADH-quinone oxidoreductase subunit M
LLTGNFAWVAFAGIFVGLAVKVPLFPFHTWLPDAYQTAPTGVSMVLTGVLSKMGVYGFVRLLLPLFPNEIKVIGPWLLALVVWPAVTGIPAFLGALVAGAVLTRFSGSADAR